MKRMPVVITIVALLVYAACGSTSEAKKENLSGKNVLILIPSRLVEDNELTVTKTILEKAGVKVTLVSPEGETVNGMHGGTFNPESGIAGIISDNYDMLTIIGGEGTFDLYQNTDVHKLVRDFADKGKFLSGICAAPGVLANAGVLKDAEATCYPYKPIIDTLTKNGAHYIDKPAVVSGKIITGNGPGAAAAFAAALVEALKS
ncbi:MAG: DJ-1/PfpI family protein [Spirochaetales bacterium]|nr:DJ-1/PfpI family protein [Spirochaetales bacterium]